MELTIRPDNVAEWRGRRYRCALGRGGVTAQKREGDGATPAGVIGLRRVLYRADRVAAPSSILCATSLAPNDGWCDAPDDPEYNCRVALPYAARCEQLWRNDGLYDLIVVTSYNSEPIVAGQGSAIFVHVASAGYQPTEGCIAFSMRDLTSILSQWRRGDQLRVVTT